MKKLLSPLIVVALAACGGPHTAAHSAASPVPMYSGTPEPAIVTPAAREAAVAVTAASPGRNLTKLGDLVRTRSPQLNFCYQESLANNPGLAGTVTVAITITSAGDVADVGITKRLWSGKGFEDVENCLTSKIRGWKFPTADEARGSYPFALSFTR